MKIFRVRIFLSVMLVIYTLFTFLSCNQISQGEQRRKFEYLYKLSNFSTYLIEYTYSLTYFRDINLYEEKMRLLSNDINGIAVLNNWKTSGRLKDLFLNIIDSNLSNMNHLKSLHYNPEYNIEKEYDVILMKERTDSFKEELDNEIVLVGKE